MKKVVAILLVLFLLTGVCACAGQTAPVEGTQPAPGQSAGSGDAEAAGPSSGTTEKTVITVALQSDISSLDPIQAADAYSANAYGCIYESLMREDAEGNIIPNLCESVEISDDNLVYTFHLPEGVLFHNGEELKAADVAFSLNRALGTAVDYLVGDIAGVEAVDDYTVNVTLKSPAGSFLSNLTTAQTGILNEKAVTDAGDSYQLSPVGTGALRFVSWTPGVSCILERYEGYRGAQCDFDELVFKTITEDTSRTIALESGEIDVAMAIPTTDLERVRENPNLKLVESTTRAFKFVGINSSKSPFNDVKVRQAVALAIDTEAITKAVKLGYAEVACSILSPNVIYADTTIPKNEYDVEKAKALLAEAGYPDGFSAVIWSDSRAEYTAVDTIVKEMLAQIGVQIEIKTLEWAAFLEACNNAEVDLYVVGWKCSTPDPDSQFFQTLHSSMLSTWNFSQVNDPYVDELLEKARASTDPAERAKLYSDLQWYFYEQKYWIPLWVDVDYIGTSARISSLTLDASGTHRWVETQVD